MLKAIDAADFVECDNCVDWATRTCKVCDGKKARNFPCVGCLDTGLQTDCYWCHGRRKAPCYDCLGHPLMNCKDCCPRDEHRDNQGKARQTLCTACILEWKPKDGSKEPFCDRCDGHAWLRCPTCHGSAKCAKCDETGCLKKASSIFIPGQHLLT